MRNKCKYSLKGEKNEKVYIFVQWRFKKKTRYIL